MNKVIYYVILSVLFTFGCASNSNKAIDTTELEKKHIKQFFSLIKDWQNNHTKMNNHWIALDTINLDLNYAIYDTSSYNLAITADSLKYYNLITQHLDTICLQQDKIQNASFWRDTTKSGNLLLEYTLYPNPTKYSNFIFEIKKRNQE